MSGRKFRGEMFVLDPCLLDVSTPKCDIQLLKKDIPIYLLN